MQSVHKGINYSCELSDSKVTYTDKSNLKKHVKNVHEGIKHSCEHCDYKATSSSHLKIM